MVDCSRHNNVDVRVAISLGKVGEEMNPLFSVGDKDEEIEAA